MSILTLEIKTQLTEKVGKSQEVKHFEKYIDAKLPNIYVQFLLEHNGGRPKKSCCELIEPIDVSQTICSVSWFYTLAKVYANLFIKYRIFLGRMPKELIPIGEDGCGNQICLAVRGNNYGKIYFWEYECEHDYDEKITYRNVYLIANSFEELIDKLYEDEVGFEFPDSIYFNEKGFPDLKPYAKFSIYSQELTGLQYKDVKIANRLSGLVDTPQGYTWHHVEDGETMLLVPYAVHKAVPHTTGAAILRSKKK